MDTLQAAWRRACAWDVAARKPGNVSHASAGHRMRAQQFLDSAAASAAAIATPGVPVGERIEAAVAATWARVGCNTNLGIVLLAAPTALAWERAGAGVGAPDAAALRRAWSTVMDGLDRADAAAAYRAIRIAQPGGLGRAGEQDVQDEPTLDLRAAMALAAGRDRIARQYRDAGVELFDIGLAALGDGAGVLDAPVPTAADHGPGAAAVQRVWLAFLASAPDAHIVRKHGAALAQSVMNEAGLWRQRASEGAALDADPRWRAWDEALKQASINPGSSADLTVATLFLAGLCRPPRA